MAVSTVPRLARPAYKSWGLVATADGDTDIVIPHGMGTLVGFVAANLVTKVQNLLAAARISDWVVSAVDATNVTVTKTTGVGSGDPGEQAVLYVELPHSIV